MPSARHLADSANVAMGIARQGTQMIIWGSKAREVLGQPGNFFCPQCLDDRRYTSVKIARYFTLYFIPLFPTETLAENVRCQDCRGDFRKDVLHHSREQILAAVSPWACQECGNTNSAGHSACLNCGRARQSAPAEAANEGNAEVMA